MWECVGQGSPPALVFSLQWVRLHRPGLRVEGYGEAEPLPVPGTVDGAFITIASPLMGLQQAFFTEA